jgi:hypothetical protein
LKWISHSIISSIRFSYQDTTETNYLNYFPHEQILTCKIMTKTILFIPVDPPSPLTYTKQPWVKAIPHKFYFQFYHGACTCKTQLWDKKKHRWTSRQYDFQEVDGAVKRIIVARGYWTENDSGNWADINDRGKTLPQCGISLYILWQPILLLLNEILIESVYILKFSL